MLINFLKFKSDHAIFLPRNIFPLCSRLTQILDILLRYLILNYFINPFFLKFSPHSMSYTSALPCIYIVLAISPKHNTYLYASENMTLPLPKMTFSPPYYLVTSQSSFKTQLKYHLLCEVFLDSPGKSKHHLVCSQSTCFQNKTQYFSK